MMEKKLGLVQPIALVMASANPDKVAEIKAILREQLPRIEILPRPLNVGEVVEDADSLLGNARLKARALATATGLASVADDTGLFVDALGGAPGIFAARYAGEDATYADNCSHLLSELKRVNAMKLEERTASFRTVAIVAWPSGEELYCEGVVRGTIALASQGARGFGYDPLFAPTETHGITFAELSIEIKNSISHRARAFRGLGSMLLALPQS
jgi:XTP/dITP diphosphohydrolase